MLPGTVSRRQLLRARGSMWTVRLLPRKPGGLPGTVLCRRSGLWPRRRLLWRGTGGVRRGVLRPRSGMPEQRLLSAGTRRLRWRLLPRRPALHGGGRLLPNGRGILQRRVLRPRRCLRQRSVLRSGPRLRPEPTGLLWPGPGVLRGRMRRRRQRSRLRWRASVRPGASVRSRVLRRAGDLRRGHTAVSCGRLSRRNRRLPRPGTDPRAVGSRVLPARCGLLQRGMLWRRRSVL